MLHFYYDRQEQILHQESYKYNTKTKLDLKLHHLKPPLQKPLLHCRRVSKHIGSAAEVSGHFGSILLLPKCPYTSLTTFAKVRKSIVYCQYPLYLDLMCQSNSFSAFAL